VIERVLFQKQPDCFHNNRSTSLAITDLYQNLDKNTYI